MVLKAARLIQLKKGKRRKMARRRSSTTKDLVVGGVGAIIGVALVSEVAGLLN